MPLNVEQRNQGENSLYLGRDRVSARAIYFPYRPTFPFDGFSSSHGDTFGVQRRRGLIAEIKRRYQERRSGPYESQQSGYRISDSQINDGKGFMRVLVKYKLTVTWCTVLPIIGATWQWVIK